MPARPFGGSPDRNRVRIRPTIPSRRESPDRQVAARRAVVSATEIRRMSTYVETPSPGSANRLNLLQPPQETRKVGRLERPGTTKYLRELIVREGERRQGRDWVSPGNCADEATGSSLPAHRR